MLTERVVPCSVWGWSDGHHIHSPPASAVVASKAWPGYASSASRRQYSQHVVPHTDYNIHLVELQRRAAVHSKLLDMLYGFIPFFFWRPLRLYACISVFNISCRVLAFTFRLEGLVSYLWACLKCIKQSTRVGLPSMTAVFMAMWFPYGDARWHWTGNPATNMPACHMMGNTACWDQTSFLSKSECFPLLLL